MSSEPIAEQLIQLIRGGNAHVTFENATKDIPFEKVGVQPPGLPYSIWMLVEHIRIAQADILEFSINSNYKPLKWPDEYWPVEKAFTRNDWQKSCEQVVNDSEQFINLITRTDVDLFTPFEHGEGQNLFREALLIADHTSYHTGQIILIRRMLGEWS